MFYRKTIKHQRKTINLALFNSKRGERGCRPSPALAVGERCQGGKGEGEGGKGEVAARELGHGGATQVYGSHDLDHVGGRQQAGEVLGPEGHALDRGHEAAEEDEGEHDEEHEKHGLLHGVGEGFAMHL